MIINSLYRYYEMLSERPNSEVPSQGYNTAKVSFAFNLSETGDLLDIIPLGEQKGKRNIPMVMQVPEQQKRSGSGVNPNFLCDNSMYMIGVDTKKNIDRAQRAFEASQKLHSLILDDIDDLGAKAVCNYFKKWVPERAMDHPALKDLYDDVLSGNNIVFRLHGQAGYIHSRPKVKDAWMRYRRQNVSDVTGQCLVTGNIEPIARLHPSIKGVNGAQSSGASLVSFNLDAFTSYGKTQSYNAPVSERVSFGYTTILNYMLASERQKIQLEPNTTVVFWSESTNNVVAENLMFELLDPSGSNSEIIYSESTTASDFETTQLVHDILSRMRNGQPINIDSEKLDLDSRFYILGLSPNNSRLSVRFWHVDSFGVLLSRMALHYSDLSIVCPMATDEPGLISTSKILQEIAPLGDQKRISPLLGGALMRSILSGRSYPQGLYTAVISRVRADQKVNYIRAGILKACLIRNTRLRSQEDHNKSKMKSLEVNITMSLDKESTNTAYRLGRLFAVLEKAQQDANPGLNATIRDRYFGAASATPRAVFPQLLRLNQHHISKAEYGDWLDKQIQEILVELKAFPSHLNLEEQGLFMLGYYHQRQAFYEKTNKKEG